MKHRSLEKLFARYVRRGDVRALGEVFDRSGSHNMVVGHGNSYTSFGGWVVPLDNTASGRDSWVSGGRDNTADGRNFSVSGGQQDLASGGNSAVAGGSVSGGYGNTASGIRSSVSGGNARTAGGDDDWVAGTLFEDD